MNICLELTLMNLRTGYHRKTIPVTTADERRSTKRVASDCETDTKRLTVLLFVIFYVYVVSEQQGIAGL